MPRVKKVTIDYEKKTMQVELVKDGLPAGTHYTPFQHYPLLTGDDHFLNFVERQEEKDIWDKLKHDIADIRKDINLSIGLCHVHQFANKSKSMDSFVVTYAFDFGKTLEQKYGDR
jgi:hypothetical protein